MSEMHMLTNKENNQLEELTYSKLEEKNTLVFSPLLRPKTLKEYLKLGSVKKSTEQSLKKVDLKNHLKSVEHKIQDESVHVKSYCKLLKHIFKLEYHHFDHDWLQNINKNSSSNLVNLQDLSLIPGRVEKFLENQHRQHDHKLKNVHTKILLEHHYQ